MIKLQGRKYNRSITRLSNMLNRSIKGVFSWSYYIPSDMENLTETDKLNIAKFFKAVALNSVLIRVKEDANNQLKKTDWKYQKYQEQIQLGLTPDVISDTLQARQDIRDKSTEKEALIKEVYGTERELEFFPSTNIE